MNRTCTVLQQGLTVGDREDRGEPFVHRASIARFFLSRCSQVNAGSATILHGPSRWTYGVNTVQHDSPRSAPLPGPPRFTTVVFDMSKPTGKTPGSSRSIRHHPGPSRWHYGSTPGTWTGVNRGVPGAQWDWGITGLLFHVINNNKGCITERRRPVPVAFVNKQRSD